MAEEKRPQVKQRKMLQKSLKEALQAFSVDRQEGNSKQWESQVDFLI